MAIGQVLSSPASGWNRYSHTDPYLKYGTAFFNDNNYHRATSPNSQMTFSFTGPSLRLYCYAYSSFSTAVEVIIDNISQGIFTTRLGSDLNTIFFEITNLTSDSRHDVIVINRDPSAYNYNNILAFTGLDISTSGILIGPWYNKTKTTIASMITGDRISFNYKATSNTFGTISQLGTSTAAEIPVASSATPDGTAYFIMVGYDTKGRKKLVADRNIQHSISWDTLNTVGIASGSGLPMQIDNKSGYTLRLLSGGVSATDKDNEWDKIIAASTLNGTITAGDNIIWNWDVNLNSITSTRSAANYIMRGAPTNSGGIPYFNNTQTTSYITYQGFRPVLLVDSQTRDRYVMFKTLDGKTYGMA